MFSRILALLAVLPMLSPPGLCICRWLESLRAAPAAVASGEAPAPPPGTRCCCCPHEADEAPADESAPDVPTPQDRPRCPQCPDWELPALAKGEVSPSLDAPLAGLTEAIVAVVVPLPSPLAADGPPLPAAAPLYLLCCDLRC
jgi:hypothetical protein